MLNDQSHFSLSNLNLVVSLKQDFAADGEVSQFVFGKVSFDAGMVSASKVSDRVTVLAYILADVDLAVGKSDLVDDVSEFSCHYLSR
ncbi:hypothetical protein ABMC88_07025, partial [Sulfitobacter sp. HNIBRBA2951]|uniref:hypothetical protein n=1 Tax=Sulfitobacter aquimarinus TaxID=3158557 RepID=UPI0032DEBFE5